MSINLKEIYPSIENPIETQDTCGDWFCSGTCVSSCGRCEYCDCPSDRDHAYYEKIIMKTYKEICDQE